MIAWIRGLVVSQHDDHVVVDVKGIGYRVFVPAPIAHAVGTGEEVTFHVHTQVREDAFHLFGFAETTDREVFRALTTVSGIGPKLAMNIMSSATREQLLTAVASSDVKRLTAIPGIGKKTAQRILVELHEVFKRLEPSLVVAGVGGQQRSAALSDVASALANLGYRTVQIDKTLAALDSMQDAPTKFDDLLREALKLIR